MGGLYLEDCGPSALIPPDVEAKIVEMIMAMAARSGEQQDDGAGSLEKMKGHFARAVDSNRADKLWDISLKLIKK